MGNRFKMKTMFFILSVCFFFSCGLLENEKIHKIAINNEYNVTYWTVGNREIAYMNLEKADDSCVETCFLATELFYNNDYIYIKSYEVAYQSYDPLTATYEYFQIKINLESEKIGDYEIKELSEQEFNKLVSQCVDCAKLDVKTLNKKE